MNEVPCGADAKTCAVKLGAERMFAMSPLTMTRGVLSFVESAATAGAAAGAAVGGAEAG